MTLIETCRAAAERLPEYAEKRLGTDEALALEDHLRGCADCRLRLALYRDVQNLFTGAFGSAENGAASPRKSSARFHQITTGPQLQVSAETEPALEEKAVVAESLLQRLGGTPWWGISVALHLLLITLLGLITMAIGNPRGNDDVVTVANLERAPQMKAAEEAKRPNQLREILENAKDVPATDPGSANTMNVIVPPEVLAQAELGDHFETINPDRPDTQSAFGNPDARMFHSANGDDSPEGGGGQGGLGGATLSEELIGDGGNAGGGAGGGFGGGIGTGIGVGTGSGHGSFGQRNGGGRRFMVARFGGNKRTESAVDKALDWLARHQEPDGCWLPSKFGGGKQDGTHIVGCTGLALLAFLGAGHSEKVGKYKDTVCRAVKWLRDSQQPDGLYYAKIESTWKPCYGHGIATMAMSEAAAMGKIKETRESAQKAVDYISIAQIKDDDHGSEREGWDYSAFDGKTGKSNTTDTSVTSWMALALKSAKVGGLHVDPACFDGVMRWLDAAQGSDEYKLGIWYRGTIAQIKEQQAKNPRLDANNVPAKEHALLAAAGLMRMYMSETKPTDARVVTTADHLLKHLPQWKTDPNPTAYANKMCFYHLYYGTLFMFQAGGHYWKDWNAALKDTVVPNQCVGGDDDGSWSPDCDWLGAWGGRVYTTAMGALCLEVYYRYLPIYK